MNIQSSHVPLNVVNTISKEEAYSLILNNTEESFLLVDKKLNIIATNKHTKDKVEDYLGIKITPGICILDLAPEYRHPLLIELYHDVFNGSERTTVIDLNTGGIKRYFEINYKPAKNENGEIVGALVTTRNITNSKKAEEALKEIEERWRFALEGTNQGVWDWNMITNDAIYSSSYKKMYGFADDELTDRIEEWITRIHPDDREKMEEALQKHMDSNEPLYESTYRLKGKDEKYKWILARGMIINRDLQGKPMRMIGTHTDITARVIAEENYKLLFYRNPLPMWTYDSKTLKFLDVNNATIKHYGYSKEEFLSMSILDIRPDEEIPDLLNALKAKNAGNEYGNTWCHRKKNGELILCEILTYKLEKENDDTILVLANDITEKVRNTANQKKVEEELKKSNERFLLAIKATSDAIYDWDLVSNDLHWSEGIQTLFGFKPGEITACIWEKLIHPDYREKVRESLKAALNNPEKKIWKEEYKFIKSDGSFSHVFEQGFIVRDMENKAVRMIGSMQDISERKYNEKLLSLERSIFELSTHQEIDFKTIVENLLVGIEEIHTDAFTSVLMLKDDGSIEPLSAPRLPEGYCQALNGLKLANEGSCGAAISSKQTVIVENIETDALWENYKHLALQFGLKACWSLPIISSSNIVLGTFGIYYKEPKTPTVTEMNTLERVRNILRILMEHYWSLNEIKVAKERFDIMMKATHDLIWDWDIQTNLIYRNEIGLKKVYGIANNESINTNLLWLERVHQDDLVNVTNMMNQIIHSRLQDNFELEYRFRKDDGSFSHVYDRGIIIRNKEGNPLRMIGAAQDITERKLLEQELIKNELERQKAINQATVDTQEQERSEIGKELHDNVNQVLTTTKLYLDLALSNPELKNELIHKSTKNIIGVINEIRQLSRSLMDPSIGDLGLIDSINDLIENINLTRKLHVRLATEINIELLLDKNQKLTIFRIIQEALNNAIKHAKASTVSICIKHMNKLMEITIEDDGIGFHPELVKKGAGLKNIQNRIYLINGTHSLLSAPDKGCKIIINFPIN